MHIFILVVANTLDFSHYIPSLSMSSWPQLIYQTFWSQIGKAASSYNQIFHIYYNKNTIICLPGADYAWYYVTLSSKIYIATNCQDAFS